MNNSLTSRAKKLFINALMLVISCMWLIPIWMMMIYATHPDNVIFSGELVFNPGTDFFKNFAILQGKQDFSMAIFNSVIIAGFSTLLGLLVASMAGYALARFAFRGRNSLFALIIFILAVPSAAIVIPEYIIVVKHMGLSNNYAGVILPYLANAVGVFFMRQSFLNLPSETLEAAYLDGASEWKIFYSIALPIVRPALASLGIILFVAHWNDYLWPMLVMTSEQYQTAPIALGRLIGLANIEWGAMMVGASLMTVPFLLLFLILQKQIIAGITSGATK